MKRSRNRIPSNDNDRWYERYGEGGFFCLPRKLLFNVVDCIDNATMYVYLALASCHYEGNTTYAGPYIAKLTGKDERAVRLHLSDLETLGLIRREPLGRGFRILFECPDRQRIKKGMLEIEARKLERQERRQAAKAAKEK
jgi:DNA-binding transcriptional ArsR family regulator